MNVRGATVLVTGANRGIGAAYVRAFLDAGAAKVYGAARDPASVTDADVVPVRMDVTNDTEVAAAAETCPDVNIVVNNAGIGFAVSALSPKVATKGRAMFDTNVFGILNVATAFAPIIEGNGGGALINVLSIGSWRTTSTLALYSASKSAAWSLTNSLRLELEPRGVQVVGVHCGFVDTDLTAGMQMAKIGPADVALATIDGIVAGQREVLVDDISRQIRAELAQDLIVQYPELNAVAAPLGAGAEPQCASSAPRSQREHPHGQDVDRVETTWSHGASKPGCVQSTSRRSVDGVDVGRYAVVTSAAHEPRR